MHSDVLKVMLSEEEIAEKVRELGAKISEDYRDKTPVFIGVLKGSVVFMSDLIRAVDCNLHIDFMVVSSYASGTKSSGQVQVLKDIGMTLEGRHVLIIEDILDSGLTLSYLKELLMARNP
ncbi:MAG: phosphoribosyltransferase family protein, partial [Oscillospiraceae bacterium]|nr:phosphoribosyltransferase family protein [Oscillospiraceae bacterium]